MKTRSFRNWWYLVNNTSASKTLVVPTTCTLEKVRGSIYSTGNVLVTGNMGAFQINESSVGPILSTVMDDIPGVWVTVWSAINGNIFEFELNRPVQRGQILYLWWVSPGAYDCCAWCQVSFLT